MTLEHLPDELLLSRKDVSANFGIPIRYLEVSAVRGDGPPMIKVGSRMVRYRVGDLREWIESRRVSSTSDAPPHNSQPASFSVEHSGPRKPRRRYLGGVE